MSSILEEMRRKDLEKAGSDLQFSNPPEKYGCCHERYVDKLLNLDFLTL